MADVPSLQQVLGVPSDIHALGRVWKFGPPSQDAKAILEELFAADAVREAGRLKRALSPVEYHAHLREVMARIDAGEYATGGPGWLAKLQNPHCHALFLLSLFRVNHPDMTAEQVKAVAAEAADELEAALVRQVPGFFGVAFPQLTPAERENLAETFRQAVQSRRPLPSGDSPPNGTAA